MPNQYKQKLCPECYSEHRKRGPFCSKVCSNKARFIKPETVEKHRENTTKFINSGSASAEVSKWAINADRDVLEHGLPLPQVDDLGIGQFVAGGDLWNEE
jgi:hypothetical protein